jgi:hypothetical protein
VVPRTTLSPRRPTFGLALATDIVDPDSRP